MLNLTFMGKAKIEYNGNRLENQLGTKATALICILVLNKNKYLSREKIEGYLWPDSDTKAARYNLRYNLWLIKKNIKEDKDGNLFIKIDNECCNINTNYKFNCDIIDIMKFEPSKEDSIVSLLKLKKLFKGDLLGGYYFKNCDEFNDLIIFERMKFEQHKVRILKRLVDLYEIKKDYDACLQVISEIHEIEPYDEEMAFKALNIYIKYEKPVAAITYYNKFSEILANSLGVLPSPKLRAKYQKIKYSLSSNSINNNILEKENYQPLKPISKKDNNNLKIVSFCINNIEYFWIADVVGKIIESINQDCIVQLDQKEILDLGCIQSNILKYSKEKETSILEYEREVISVNIINAFIKLLKCVCKTYNLKIIILNSSSMDDISISVLNYLQNSNIENLTFIEE